MSLNFREFKKNIIDYSLCETSDIWKLPVETETLINEFQSAFNESVVPKFFEKWKWRSSIKLDIDWYL